MKNLTKTFSVLLITVILCISSFTSVFAAATIPQATPDFYVNDFAGIFTAEEKNTLINTSAKMADENNGIQIVISTIKSLEGDTVENYALNMYNQYGIGKNDMGLLILLSTEDREIRVEVGRAMEAYINDAKAGRFIDKYAIPYLKENKFNEGLINLHSVFINEITESIAAENAIVSTTNSNSLPSINFSILFGILAIIILLVLFIYIALLISKKIKKRKTLISDLNAEISRLNNTITNLKDQHVSERKELTTAIGNLEHDKHSLESTLSQTKSKLSTLTDRHERILKIYPDADLKVDNMLKEEQIQRDKDAASKVDALIASVITLSASKDIVSKLDSVISGYNNLSNEQKQYINSDVSKLKTLYNNSLKLKNDYEDMLEKERIRKLTNQRKERASSVTKEIFSVISSISIAKAHHLFKLSNAKDLYEDLDSSTQKYVDSSVISKLNSLISAAKRDKEEQEEERRRKSYSSNSFNRSSSSFGARPGGFGGFGGRSNGGGASRKF